MLIAALNLSIIFHYNVLNVLAGPGLKKDFVKNHGSAIFAPLMGN
jgi:hypothetical protein